MESGRIKLGGLKKPIQYYDIAFYLEMNKISLLVLSCKLLEANG